MTRIEKLRSALPKEFGAALVTHSYNRGYLTDFLSSDGILLITQTEAYLFVDFRYIEAAHEKVTDAKVILMNDTYKQILEILTKEAVAELYVEQEISVGLLARITKELEGVKVLSDETLSKAVRRMRAIKEASEVAAIRRAQEITDKAFLYILSRIKPGMTEREIAADLEYHMRKNGADGMAFPTICVAGVKSSMPHGTPGDNEIQRGDFVTMDFGALKDGYCSDMTRTVAVGKVTAEKKKVYETVLLAQTTAMAAARAGIKGSDLDKTARDIIYSAGYEGCFGHGLGHSLGLEIHEEPRASLSSGDILECGTIVTVEPGIYLQGKFGVRIENMVVLEEGGNRNLTDSPRELVEL